MRRTMAIFGALVAAALLPSASLAAGVAGTVFAADSTTAVANATVVLSAPGAGGGARTPVDTAQTDAQGKFAFSGLAVGDNYGVSISAAGFRPYTNNNLDLAADTTAVSLTVILAVIPPPAAISGTVVGADTVTPIPSAAVVLSRAGTGGGGGGGRTPVDTAQTDAQGKFSFPALAAADNYGLTVTFTGYNTYTNNNIDLAGKDTALVIRIVPTPPPAAIGGTVVGADSVTPVANATVVLTRAGTGGGGGARTPVDTLQTDAQGKFSFPALAAANNYGLTVTATGFQAATRNGINLAGKDTSVTVVLTPPPPPGLIRGTVYGADSATAVPNATVILSRPGTGGGGGGARQPVDTAQTDAQGKFSFPGVAALQNYGISVVATGFQPYANNNVDINGGDTATVDVRLIPPGAPGIVSGTVRTGGGAGATPLPNATVVLRSPLALGGLPLDTAQTDTAGHFSFASVPSMDNYVVTVSATGYNGSTNNNVDVDSGATATVNFNLVSTAIFRAARDLGTGMTWMNGALAIRFPSAGARRLTAYAPDGAARFQADIPSRGGSVTVPAEVIRQPGTVLIVSGSGRRTLLALPPR